MIESLINQILLLSVEFLGPEDKDPDFDPERHDCFFSLACGKSTKGGAAVMVEVFLHVELGKFVETLWGA